MEDHNYEGIISKLAKGSITEKAISLQKLLRLYEQSRSRVFLYERRIVESLQLSLLIDEKDISLNALQLLDKIIINSSPDSETMHIITKKLLSKIVVNLGSVGVLIRKISHKCISEYLRKFKDYQTISKVYLKSALQQSENYKLKVKAINSFHSLLVAEEKYYSHDSPSAVVLFSEMVDASFQKSYPELQKSAIMCLIFLLKIPNSEAMLRKINENAQNQLYELRNENSDLAELLDSIMHLHRKQVQDGSNSSIPSPKFMSINDSEVFSEDQCEDHTEHLQQHIERFDAIQTTKCIQHLDCRHLENQHSDLHHSEHQHVQQNDNSQIIVEKIPETKLKIFNDVSYAEEFLKKLEKNSLWVLEDIREFSPYLEKYLTDNNIKLFSISKRIVETIFDSEKGTKKEYYIVLVPNVVNGIGNKRFIVRKKLDKLVRQYLKNHTEVWVKNFLDRFARSTNYKVKEMLLDLLAHAYKTSPEFYYPTEKALEIFDNEITDKSSNLKWKVIDCIIFVLDKQAKTPAEKEALLQSMSSDSYNKILRKISKSTGFIGSFTKEYEADPLSPVIKRDRTTQRLLTDDHLKSVQKNSKEKPDNKSEDRKKIKYHITPKEKRMRLGQLECQFKSRKHDRIERISQLRSKERTSLQKLPELKRSKQNSNVLKCDEMTHSPNKKSLADKSDKNIVYVQKENLREMQDPKGQLDKAIIWMKDSNWSTQFQSINLIRSVVEFHTEIVSSQYHSLIIGELLQCLNSMRSGVCKISLICLCELMMKFQKKMAVYTDQIILALMKKSITNSEFLQDEIRKCLNVAADQLCASKIMQSLISLRETRSNEVKINILVMTEIMVRNQKIYRRETEELWLLLVEYHEDQHYSIRNQCKRIIIIIIQTYKDWKNTVMNFNKLNLHRIDKILRNITTKPENQWVEQESAEFQKLLASKTINPKYFSAEYHRFEDHDKNMLLKKNYKERMKLANTLFSTAIQFPSDFQKSPNSKKYFLILYEHLDDKNPGLMLNALNIISKTIEVFPQLYEETLYNLLEKLVSKCDNKKVQLSGTTIRIYEALYCRLNTTKILKEYLRIYMNNNNSKIRSEIRNQLIYILRKSRYSNGPQRQKQDKITISHPQDKKNILFSFTPKRNSIQNTSNIQELYPKQFCLTPKAKPLFSKFFAKMGLDDRCKDSKENSLREVAEICEQLFGDLSGS